jgi:hypothetical protein
MPYVKCSAAGCVAQAYPTYLNPACCKAHTVAHYAAGGLNVSGWLDQMERTRVAARGAAGPDGRLDLVQEQMRDALSARKKISNAPIEAAWFLSMTAMALDTIDIAPANAFVIFSEPLFEHLWGDPANAVPASARRVDHFVLRQGELRLAIDPLAIDSRLCYDDFCGERMVVVYPPIDGLR